MLFSPAVAIVTAIDSGETFRAGALAPELLAASFGA
jgi:methenyltetrahydromethanopterin cyclohydrolase